ncbi:MAG: aminoglycoside phosphotransferase family protein [Chitinophagaceae bacterium]|nr:MAG: aminoglycoside phosphotransferase family protein [Chitinophagaceae bacterium]
MLASVLSAYGFDAGDLRLERFGNGLINHTWKITAPSAAYILQRINSNVFKNPLDIDHNIRSIERFLSAHFPTYPFVAPLKTKDGKTMYQTDMADYYRIFPYVKGSHTIDVVQTPEQAYEAATQFGRFSRLLSGLDISDLKITIPGFHDLSLRERQFFQAIPKANKERSRQAENLINTLQGFSDIVATYEAIKTDPELKLRVTHHDTKISNVLLNERGKGLAVIDLDTVMPGYFISDVGDMIRTSACSASEEEADFTKVYVKRDFYNAIIKGYHNEMQDELSTREKELFLYSGKFIIYMQAIRFLTDFLEGDGYYGANYPQQNLVRAGNQVALLKSLYDM